MSARSISATCAARSAATIAATFAAALALGCVDGVDPDGPVLCASDADCPGGLTCALTRHECVAADARTDAPALLAVRFEPAITNGDVVTLIVEASEALSQEPDAAPHVELAAGTPALTLALAEIDGAVATFNITAPDEGVYAIARVTVVDVDGDVGTRALNDTALIVDRTPPTVFNTALVDPPADGTYADRPGRDDLVVHALANEPLASAALGLDAGSDGACTLGGTALDCSLAIDAATEDGMHVVTLAATDLAGNVTAIDIATIDVDTAAPAIADGSVAVEVATSAGRVTVSFLATEALGPPAPRVFVDALAGPVPFTQLADGLTFAVDGFSVPAGDHAIRATLTDRVGHEATVFVADFPELVGCPGSASAPACFDIDGDRHHGVDGCTDIEGDDPDDTSPLVYPGAIEIPGDGVDNDGFGGELAIADADGVFVDSEIGDDANDGTAGAPVQTLSAADARATDDAPLFLVVRATPYAGTAGDRSLIGVAPSDGDDGGLTRARLTEPLAVATGAVVLAHIEALALVAVTGQPNAVVLDCALGELDADGVGHVTIVDSSIITATFSATVEVLVFHSELGAVLEQTGADLTLLSAVTHGAVEVGSANLTAVNTAFIAPSGSSAIRVNNGAAALYHCTVLSDGFPGIEAVGGAQAFTAINTLFAGVSPTEAAIHAPSTTIWVAGSTCNSNLVYGVPIADVNTCNFDNCVSPSVGNRENVAGGFTSAFQIGADSLARDGGVDPAAFDAPNHVVVDFQLQCRFSDGAPDVGADEYTP